MRMGSKGVRNMLMSTELLKIVVEDFKTFWGRIEDDKDIRRKIENKLKIYWITTL